LGDAGAWEGEVGLAVWWEGRCNLMMWGDHPSARVVIGNDVVAGLGRSGRSCNIASIFTVRLTSLPHDVRPFTQHVSS